MEYALALLVLAALVALAVRVPLRRPEQVEAFEQTRIEELRAAKEAKYREIRDAELDHRMGKLSDERLAGRRRRPAREAIMILRELDPSRGAVSMRPWRVRAGRAGWRWASPCWPA